MIQKEDEKRLRVLLLEADEQFAHKIQKVLIACRERLFRVYVAEKLSGGLETLSDWQFDAVLLDLFLPDSQGFETLAKIQKTAPNLAVIVLGETVDSSLFSQATQQGVLGFLSKTDFDPNRLIRTLFFAIEQHQREQNIALNERRYREVIENLKDAYFEIDLSGFFTYANDAGIAHLGRPRHEVIGSNSLDYNETPEQSERNIKVYMEVHQTGRTGILDSTLIRPDGSLITIEHRASLIRDAKGKPIGFSGISRDVTEQKAIHNALQTSKEKYQTILENIEDGYFEVDLKGRMIFYNEGMGTIFGYTVEELAGRDYRVYMDEANAQKVYQAFRRIYETGEPNGSLQYELITKQGLRRFVEASVSLMKNDQGRPIGFRGVARDITKQKEFELELARAKEKAEAATQAKSEFLANMSHEIRTPMNGIIGMYNLLKGTSLTNEQADFVLTGKESAESLLGIINDILDFSKMEAGKLDIETIDFDLHDIIDKMVVKPALLAQEKGLEFLYIIDHKIPPLLSGDPCRLRQILLNLISNAVKFTPQGEVVLRGTLQEETPDKAALLFTVQDTGIGISEADQIRLFQSFQQVDSSSTRKYGGTGLGLAIAKRLTALLGGEMGVESRLDHGSTFRLKVTFAKSGTVAKAAPMAPDEVRTKRVLIVDDNKTSLDMLESYLKQWGCNCDRADNGALALSIMKAVVKSGTPYDVVISDMLMPVMDGAELGRRIKADKDFADPMLIMLTSQGMRGQTVETERIGYAAYLNKPVNPSKLYDCLATVFSKDAKAKTVVPPKTIASDTPSEDKRHHVKILLAEDDIVNQKVAFHLLARFGFQAEVVSNGKEALDALSARDYDLVFMDIHMPEMDGLTAAALIRDPNSSARNHKVPIIAMTATDTQEDRNICLEAGMDDYIAKPIVPDKLIPLIERWTIGRESSEVRK